MDAKKLAIVEVTLRQAAALLNTLPHDQFSDHSIDLGISAETYEYIVAISGKQRTTVYAAGSAGDTPTAIDACTLVMDGVSINAAAPLRPATEEEIAGLAQAKPHAPLTAYTKRAA